MQEVCLYTQGTTLKTQSVSQVPSGIQNNDLRDCLVQDALVTVIDGNLYSSAKNARMLALYVEEGVNIIHME
jgi:hypothetical protein